MNLSRIFDALKPHLLIVGIFLAVCLIYFLPVLKGKKLATNDIKQHEGMAQELSQFKDETGESSLWTNSMFGGMPSYQIATPYPNSLFILKYGYKLITQALPKPINMMFLFFLSFYLMLLAFNVNRWLAFAGALAFGFSTYNTFIIEAGHNTKAIAIGLAPLVLAAIHFTYRSKYWILGAGLAGLALGFEIKANHIQITYYLFFIILAYGISMLIAEIKSGNAREFISRSALLLAAFAFGIGANSGNLLTTAEYGRESTRGKSDLVKENEKTSDGLDIDYATAWSYGVAETGTLLIPGFYGGASGEKMVKDGELWNLLAGMGLKDEQLSGFQMPLYWGEQPFVSGPIYYGIIVIFLFVLGILILDNRERIWMILVSILAIMLAWGHNFMPLTQFFFDYIPGYNKFRIVSMILVIPQIVLPLMAVLTLKKFFTEGMSKDWLMKSLKIALGIVGGLCLLFWIMPGSFLDFTSAADPRQFKGLIDQGIKVSEDEMANIFMNDRMAMLRKDALRSLLFLLLAAAPLYLYLINKLKMQYVVYMLAFFMAIDVWMIDMRYLDHDSFVKETVYKTQVKKLAADNQILADKDPDFRVLNLTVSPFNDATTSYFHKSLGGYHGAKLERFEELKNTRIMDEMSQLQQTGFQNPAVSPVINMFNTKYYIIPMGQQKPPVAYQNTGACGHAWFVDEVVQVENANAEIDSLAKFNPLSKAFADKRFSSYLEGFSGGRPSGKIKLVEYKPNYLKYEYDIDREGFAVFSEVYYRGNLDWVSTIDKESKDHIRVNYHLRGMRLPAGKHTVEFKFEPKTYYTGETYSLVFSISLLLMLLFGIWRSVKIEQNVDTKS